MSFSRTVKEELLKRTGNARHCRIAELAALTSILGKIQTCNGEKYLELRTETKAVCEQICFLTEKLFGPVMEVESSRQGRLETYCLRTQPGKAAEDMLKTLKVSQREERLSCPDALTVQRSCCRRAFIRGAFLAAGSVSNPEKTYHFEIVLAEESFAEYIRELLFAFGIEAKTVMRKKAHVVYVKEGSQISDLLNVMEAHVALMQMENVRILKDMRNSINRQVNCETANISKTVNAAAKQIEDIIYIRDTVGFGDLKEELAEIAMLRLEHPETSLKELGTLLSVPIGKSGVNHRLAKLCEIAEKLRNKNLK